MCYFSLMDEETRTKFVRRKSKFWYQYISVLFTFPPFFSFVFFIENFCFIRSCFHYCGGPKFSLLNIILPVIVGRAEHISDAAILLSSKCKLEVSVSSIHEWITLKKILLKKMAQKEERQSLRRKKTFIKKYKYKYFCENTFSLSRYSPTHFSSLFLSFSYCSYTWGHSYFN